jgi:hypothetical protein
VLTKHCSILLKKGGFDQEILARMFHELLSRDREDGRATWQPQGVGSEAYLNGTSQGPAISVVAASDS